MDPPSLGTIIYLYYSIKTARLSQLRRSAKRCRRPFDPTQKRAVISHDSFSYTSRLFIGKFTGDDAAQALKGVGLQSRCRMTGIQELLIRGIQLQLVEIDIFHGRLAVSFGSVFDTDLKYEIGHFC